MKKRTKVRVAMTAAILLAASLPCMSYAQQLQESARSGFNKGVKNIVLVHGAWADGSSWSGVIPLLEADGYHVIAAQLPLSSLEDDDAATERAMARITTLHPGPVLLVGHSYGGVVIGDKPGNDPNVAGLVYVAAFAPDSGESALSLLATLTTPSPLYAVSSAGQWQAVRNYLRRGHRRCFCSRLIEIGAGALNGYTRPGSAWRPFGNAHGDASLANKTNVVHCFDSRYGDHSPAWRSRWRRRLGPRPSNCQPAISPCFKSRSGWRSLLSVPRPRLERSKSLIVGT